MIKNNIGVLLPSYFIVPSNTNQLLIFQTLKKTQLILNKTPIQTTKREATVSLITKKIVSKETEVKELHH